MIRTVAEPVRALRLGAFAASATVLALGAHLAAGGAPPAPLPTAAAVALPALAGYALSRRRRGPVEIGVVLGAVQLVLHEILAAAGGPAGHAAAAHAGHLGAAEPAGGAMAGTGPAGAPVVMAAAHLGAVVLTALLLARGERWLAELGARLRTVTRRRWPRPPWPLRGPPRVAGPLTVADRELPTRRGCAPVVRRGPPLPGR